MLDTNQSVASVVLDHSETGPVFQRNRIDFCCKGEMSLGDACAQRGLDPKALIGELERAIAERRGEVAEDPRSMTVFALIAHIVSRHHAYLRKTLPFVRTLAAKVARVHGDHQPSLRELDEVVVALCESLEPHLDQEESVLFPAMMAQAGDREVIRRELAAMQRDHLEVGGLLERARALTADFAPEPWACNSYRTLYAELEALEGDVLRHVHLENHVLMPRFAGS